MNAVATTRTAPTAVKAAAFARDLVALTKPGIVVMTLVTASWGLGLAPGTVSPWTVLAALIGTALSVGSANAFNMVLERDTDALMARTRNRPLPQRRLLPGAAWAFALTTAVASVALLTAAVNLLTALLSTFALVTYAFVYTPMKQRSTAALPVGAVAGAMPPLLGWTAATGRVDVAGLLLFLVLFWWQIPHFLAISMFRQADYDAAGIKIVPSAFGEPVARALLWFTSVALVASTLALVALGVTGPAYAVAAVAAGAWLIAGAARVRALGGPRRFFLATLVHLPALAAGMLIDGLLR